MVDRPEGPAEAGRAPPAMVPRATPTDNSASLADRGLPRAVHRDLNPDSGMTWRLLGVDEAVPQRCGYGLPVQRPESARAGKWSAVRASMRRRWVSSELGLRAKPRRWAS